MHDFCHTEEFFLQDTVLFIHLSLTPKKLKLPIAMTKIKTTSINLTLLLPSDLTRLYFVIKIIFIIIKE